jgi:hypothetical protein
MKTSISFLLSVACLAITMSTSQYSNSRTGSTTSESVLTPANVSRLQSLGHYTVDGAVWAQPLYIPDVTISGAARNLLIVATLHGTVYAFDADNPGSAAVWSRHVSAPRASWPHDVNLFYANEQGCLATPVVDTTNSWVYALCANTTPNHVLYQLSLTDGTVVNSVAVTGSVTGTGDPDGDVPDNVSGGTLTFYPTYELGRAALTLANSRIYVAFTSQDDVDPSHGWVMAYDSTLTLQATFCTTPNGALGTIWLSGGGLPVDGSGNLYLTTGNGDWDGTANFSMSAIKLSSSLVMLDWFTPTDHAAMSAADEDLASGRVMLIPGTTLLSFADKHYNVYGIDTSCMGHLGGTQGGCAAPQVFVTTNTKPDSQGGAYGGVMFLDTHLFVSLAQPLVGNTQGAIYGFSLSGSTYNTTPTVTSATFAYPSAQLSGSSNSGSNGIVWALTVGTNSEFNAQSVTLRAFNPSTLAELWNSGTIGQASKFAVPTIAHGMAFVGTNDSGVQVFGLPPSAQLSGLATMSGKTTIQ